MPSERAQALMVLTDIMFITHRSRIVQMAAKSRLPAVYGEQEFVEANGAAHDADDRMSRSLREDGPASILADREMQTRRWQASRTD